MKKIISVFSALLICLFFAASCGFKDNGMIEGTYEEKRDTGETAFLVIGEDDIQHSVYDKDGYLIRGTAHTISRSLATVDGDTWRIPVESSYQKGVWYDYYLYTGLKGYITMYQISSENPRWFFTKISNQPNFD